MTQDTTNGFGIAPSDQPAIVLPQEAAQTSSASVASENTALGTLLERHQAAQIRITGNIAAPARSGASQGAAQTSSASAASGNAAPAQELSNHKAQQNNASSAHPPQTTNTVGSAPSTLLERLMQAAQPLQIMGDIADPARGAINGGSTDTSTFEMPWDYYEDPAAWLNRRAAMMYRKEA